MIIITNSANVCAIHKATEGLEATEAQWMIITQSTALSCDSTKAKLTTAENAAQQKPATNK